GRFGAGLPRINDGSLLFAQHMISKMKPSPENGGEGSRIAVVFNGSPLFTGDAGSGESNIRRWVIENDWLEAIIALPDQMFYN
ncbi:N-6 DNA methylase, partial [Acinetobacter baumannii]